MDSQESYSEQVYEILRDFLPQIQRQIREELESKFRKTYDERLQIQIKQVEEDANRKYQEQLVRVVKDKEIQIKAEYERILESKIREIEANNEQALRRFKQQVKEKHSNEGNKDQQLNVLLQQKANWQKLEKQYQAAIRELGTQDESKIKFSGNSSMANSRGKTPPTVLGTSSNDNTRVKPSINNPSTLKIDIPRERRLDIQADLGSDMFRKDDNTSDYSSLLSPPHIEHEELDRRKPSLKDNTNNTSEKKKPFFWNEEKKKELLDMIRKRIM